MPSKFDLEEIKDLVEKRLAGNDTVLFDTPGCSVSYVVHVLICDEREATWHILQGLLRLKPQDFSQSVVVWNEVADEYGLEDYIGHNWYIKFYIEDVGGNRILNEVSFHPVEKPLALANGRILKPTVKEEDRPKWRKKKSPGKK